MNKQGHLLVVSGPSGCGKDTLVDLMICKYSGIELSVSATTRAPRAGEKDGESYHFVTNKQFKQFIAQDKLVEYAHYVEEYYGTLKSEVESRIEKGITCVLVIEVEGAGNVKKLYPNCTTVFVLPPSMEELERRLRSRGSEEDVCVQKRLSRAREEMKFANSYDFTVVNDDKKRCADEIYEILKKRQQE